MNNNSSKLKKLNNFLIMDFNPIKLFSTKNKGESTTLYIPNKDLLFIKHPKHGKVYPVYIADEVYNKKTNPAKYMIPCFLFTGFNFFILFSGLQIIPVTNLYSLFYSNDMFLLTSMILNYLFLRKYFKFVGNYENRVKSLFLQPSGDKIIIETFDGTIKKFENFDIFEFNLRNKFSDIENKTFNWKPIYVTNDNNFRCTIKWGRNSENFFEGRAKIMDYEIFSQIISRTNIDTTIKKFKRQMPLGYYTHEEKMKILKHFSDNKKTTEKIDYNRISYYYKMLRNRFIHKPTFKNISDEYKFYY
jgi:hypothetical protein